MADSHYYFFDQKSLYLYLLEQFLNQFHVSFADQISSDVKSHPYMQK